MRVASLLRSLWYTSPKLESPVAVFRPRRVVSPRMRFIYVVTPTSKDFVALLRSVGVAGLRLYRVTQNRFSFFGALHAKNIPGTLGRGS
jgi:hypothetical protein